MNLKLRTKIVLIAFVSVLLAIGINATISGILYQDSQRRAARERLLNEITSRIRNSATLEGVLNSAVQKVGQVTRAGFAAIELEPLESNQPPWGE
jgi:hypothetical protein